MTLKLGIMQGRLSNKPGQKLQSFPYESWESEFNYAKELELDCIEYLIDNLFDSNNPITSQTGRSRINEIIEKTNVKVNSICAHNFIDYDFLNIENNQKITSEIEEIIEWANDLKVKFINIPIEFKNKNFLKLDNIIQIFHQIKFPNNMNLLIESDLNERIFKKFLEDIDNKGINILFDTGNTNFSRIDSGEFLDSLCDRVLEIHLKDRSKEKGSSHRLGNSNTPFNLIANKLNDNKWNGLIVLETPIFDNWEIEATYNVKFAKNWISSIKGSI